MAETKECPVCDQTIGATEETCPKCQTNLDDLESEVTVVTRAMSVAEKRRKKKEAEELAAHPAAKAPKSKHPLASLQRLAGGE